jgi:hypothetical protein
MMSAPQIRIRRLRLRVPGGSKEAGSALAQGLREQLGNLPSGTAATHIGALRLRIPGPPGLDTAGLSAAITHGISSKLARHPSHPHA